MASQVGRLLRLLHPALALVAAIAFLFLCSSHLPATPAFAMSSELVIKSVYLPENAASLPKTKKGDKISVYYVRPTPSYSQVGSVNPSIR